MSGPRDTGETIARAVGKQLTVASFIIHYLDWQAEWSLLTERYSD
jgi:hypothetical protein